MDSFPVYISYGTNWFWILNKLYKGFPGKDILDIGEDLGGKPVKVIREQWFDIITSMMMVSLRLFANLLI